MCVQSGTLIFFVLGLVSLTGTPDINVFTLFWHVIFVFAYSYGKQVLNTYIPIQSFPLTADGSVLCAHFELFLARQMSAKH